MKRPSYSKEQRERAKARGHGLATIDVVRPDGSRSCLSIVATADDVAEIDAFMLKLIDRQQKK